MTETCPNGSSKRNQPAPFQFGLKTLLGTVLLSCIVCGFYSQFGVLGVAYAWYVLLTLAMVVAACRKKHGEALACVALLLFSSCLLFVAVAGPQRDSGRCPCFDNLKNISLAIQRYADKYGRLPPPYIADKDGKPMHSWRVLILPFMDTYERDLYKQYRFDEPWNGPNNRKLAGKMPPVYRCPVRKRKRGEFLTDYVAVTGPNTVWPVDQRVGLRDVPDGTSNTLMVVESANCGISWLEPLDLDVDTIPMKINPKTERGISSVHPGGVLGVLVDGSVQFLPNSMPSNTVKALLIRNDGQEVDWRAF